MSAADAIQSYANQIAISVTATGASGSNRLLFFGGLALLAFVLADAAFLAFSARALRESSGN
jgi:hypothetical protein